MSKKTDKLLFHEKKSGKFDIIEHFPVIIFVSFVPLWRSVPYYAESRVIHVEHLSKEFRDYQRGWVSAVSDVSFDCHPGTIFGLLGPNGAGKTTTLRILSTVLRPTGGRAVVAGFDVLENPEGVRANIGYMSASTGIYDRMTAWELVEYFGRLYGLTPERLRERWRRSSTGSR